jgi:hypothetical protein
MTLLLLIRPEQAAIDEHGCPRDVARVRRSQESATPATSSGVPRRFSGIFSSSGLSLPDRSAARIDRRFDRTWSDSVNGNSEWGELDGKIARQHLEPSLACTVAREMRERKFFVHRADVDDLSGQCGV